MSWGGLNPALTAWRNGIAARFPGRGTASDGGYADQLHGSASEHQADADGTVDAFDMDVNLLASTSPAGTSEERRLIEALKKDFEADRRAQLWIHAREIANRDVGTWSERYYGGANAHDKHVHWQSRPAYERDGSPWRFPHTDALIEEMTMPTAAEIAQAVLDAPITTQPDGRRVSVRAILAWMDSVEVTTRSDVNRNTDAEAAKLAALLGDIVARLAAIEARLAAPAAAPPTP